MKLLTVLLIAVCFTSVNLLYAQPNCEVTVKLPTSNTPGTCGFTIKDSLNNVLLRENAVGSLFLNMPPNVGGIVHQGEILSINRGPVRLFSAGYYLPENLYYIDIPDPVKMTATWFAAREIHSWPGDTLFLDPNGSTRVRSSLTVDGYTRINNSGCYTGTWAQCSDLKLKKNISKIDNALNKILRLQGVNYEWRNKEFPSYNFEEGTKIGFVAQEVEEILPELVKTENDGVKSVAYSNMIPVLVEAIKEQQKLIDLGKDKEALLNERINLLQAQLSEQQEKINTITTMISELKEKDNTLKVSENNK